MFAKVQSKIITPRLDGCPFDELIERWQIGASLSFDRLGKYIPMRCHRKFEKGKHHFPSWLQNAPELLKIKVRLVMEQMCEQTEGANHIDRLIGQRNSQGMA